MSNFLEITDDQRWQLLNNKRFEQRIVAVFDLFRQYGIEPILIKGWVAARYYPPELPRIYSDIDLAVESTQFNIAKSLLSSPPGNSLGIDLHRELRHLDTLPWRELMLNSTSIDIDGVGVRILSPEDHFRVLCVHWLTDGGEVKERLWDIYYAVSKRPTAFDWGKCLDVVSENRRRWVICTIGLAHYYLGLEIDDLPFAEEARKLPAWLVRNLENQWASGIRLRGLDTCLRDPKAFLQQLRKRFPPNPITATIDMDGSFDSKTRFFYQIGDIFRRSGGSVDRIVRAILRKENE